MSTLVIFTATPAITAPVLSVTRPTTLAEEVWATAAPQSSAAMTKRRNMRKLLAGVYHAAKWNANLERSLSCGWGV